MIAVNIIPLTNLPRGKDCYSYQAPKQCRAAVCQLVKIPFRRRIVSGIVWSISSGPSKYDLKQIIDVGPRILTTEQFQLIDTITRVYGGSRSHILRAIVAAQRSLCLNNAIHPTAKSKPRLIVQSLNGQIEFLRTAGTTRRGQTLILAPTAEHARRALQALTDRSGVFILTPQTTRAQMKSLAESLQRGDPITVVGTRRSLLLPWLTLQTIVVIDEHHPAHVQWDLEPRIDNRIVARWLATIWHARLIFSTPLPSLGTAMSIPLSQWSTNHKLIKLNERPCLRFWQQPTTEHQQWCAWITDQLHAQRSVRIIAPPFNRNHAICRSCRKITRCLTCDRPIEIRGTHWYCSWCKKDSTVLRCSQCKGSEFRALPSGIDIIRTTVDKYIPGTNNRLSIFQPPSLLHWIEQLRISDVAPDQAYLVWDVFTSASAGYTQNERGKQLIALLSGAIQTQPNLSLAVLNTPDDWLPEQSMNTLYRWFVSESQARVQFHYPPHYPIIMLDRHATKQEKESNIDNGIVELKRIAARHHGELLGPYISRTRRKGFFNRSILVLRSTLQQSVEDFAAAIVPSIPSGWSITINPEYIPSLA